MFYFVAFYCAPEVYSTVHQYLLSVENVFSINTKDVELKYKIIIKEWMFLCDLGIKKELWPVECLNMYFIIMQTSLLTLTLTFFLFVYNFFFYVMSLKFQKHQKHHWQTEARRLAFFTISLLVISFEFMKKKKMNLWTYNLCIFFSFFLLLPLICTRSILFLNYKSSIYITNNS